MQGIRKGLLLLPIIVAVLVVGSLGGACTAPAPATSKPTTASSAPTTSTSAPAPVAEQPAGELKIAMTNFQKEVMDPSLDSGLVKPYLIPMYDYLVGVDVDGKLSKDYGLARDWKVEHSGNSSVYTFYVRQGVKFHDGPEVTAHDVKFSLEYFMRQGSLSSYFATLRGLIDRIEVPSQYEVVVHTKSPYAFLLTDLSSLGYTEGMVLPKAYIEKNGTDYFNKHPIGTGPYKFKEQKQGTSITYEAIDYKHWLQQPKHKTVTFMLAPEESTRIAMLKTGEADVIDSLSRNNIPSLEAAGFRAFSWKSSLVIELWLGQTWDEATYLNDVRVRDALNLAVDRQAILDQILKKAGKVTADGHYGSWAYGYQPLPPYGYDPEKAKSLLAQTMKDKGWSNVELTFYSYPWAGVPEMGLVVEAAAGMWTKTFGDLIKVQIVPVAGWAVYRQILVDKKASNTVGPMAAPNVPFWSPGWQNNFHTGGLFTMATTPELDARIDKVREELDLTKVGQLQYEVAKYMQDNRFVVPLVELDDVRAANPKKVTHWEMGKFKYDPNLRDILVQGRAYPAK